MRARLDADIAERSALGARATGRWTSWQAERRDRHRAFSNQWLRKGCSSTRTSATAGRAVGDRLGERIVGLQARRGCGLGRRAQVLELTEQAMAEPQAASRSATHALEILRRLAPVTVDGAAATGAPWRCAIRRHPAGLSSRVAGVPGALDAGLRRLVEPRRDARRQPRCRLPPGSEMWISTIEAVIRRSTVRSRRTELALLAGARAGSSRIVAASSSLGGRPAARARAAGRVSRARRTRPSTALDSP